MVGKVAAGAVAGASVTALCALGDDLLLAETGAVYNKKVEGKGMDKGKNNGMGGIRSLLPSLNLVHSRRLLPSCSYSLRWY